nr:class I SAM-dependent methyltransferase [Coralloluteibacterium stylophorae]
MFHALADPTLKPAADARVLVLGARESPGLHAARGAGWVYEQDSKPRADALARAGLATAPPAPQARFDRVLVLPPRQREQARALLARAVSLLAEGGIVLAAMPNTEGARSGATDLARLAGDGGSLSKFHCRAFWCAPRSDGSADAALVAEWQALDAIRPILDGRYLSRPGLFAWDRVDAGSALLAEHLPADLAGRVADLGAGWGFLASELLRRCPRIAHLDLYEADARALEPARANLGAALLPHADGVAAQVHWHDVTAGLPARYDAIVSNPPFHQGRADDPALGRAFIDAAADALAPQGRLILVANRHLPYEATLARRFAQVRTLADRDGFKVLAATQARA